MSASRLYNTLIRCPGLHQSFSLAPPSSPHPRRHSGFGQPTIGRSATSNRPLPFLLFHFAWLFLTPDQRQLLATSFPLMMLYAHLRLRALQKGNAISYLRTPRSNPDETSPVDMARALDMGCALLRFNLIYGDLIHWFGGFYTDAHRDWSAVFEQLQAVDDCIPPPGYPKVNLHWLF